MVAYKREIALWRETDITQRAWMIRDDADTYWIACQMQHDRILNPGPDVINDRRSNLVQRRIDVDLFIVSLHRLHAVAELAAKVADTRRVLPTAIAQFDRDTAGLPLSENEAESATIAHVRHAFEHAQNLEIRGGLGLASGPEGWWISYRTRMFETKNLLTSAESLHQAIRAAVDLEAFSDFRGNSPYIELCDSACINQSPPPGSELVAHWPTAMAEIETRLARMQKEADNDQLNP